MARNKKCVTLNLASCRKGRTLRGLAKKVDVVIENFCRGTLENGGSVLRN